MAKRIIRTVSPNRVGQPVDPDVKMRAVVSQNKYDAVRYPRVHRGKINSTKYHSIQIPRNTIGPDEAYSPRVAVLVHIYYDDLVEEMLEYLEQFPVEFDLYVSLATGTYPETSAAVSAKRDKIAAVYPGAHIELVPNLGKDIGGKLALLKTVLDKEYDYMVFAHDKHSHHMSNRAAADKWRTDLLSACFSKENVYLILDAFSKNRSIGMCGAKVRDGIINSREIAVNLGNFPLIEEAYQRWFGVLPQTGAFIGGTMFWVRFSLFKSAFTAEKIDEILKELEPGNVMEPSVTHAMERIFGILVTSAGYKIGAI